MKRRAICRMMLASIMSGAVLLPLHAEEAPASDTGLLKLNFSARIDWQLNRPYNHTDDANSGFEGKYLMLRADGEIIPGLSYSWRQRLNKMHADRNFFDATDWLYVNYETGRWSFEAGKEIVAIGGWEYDRAPMDLFGTSVFWNNIPCYQLGVTTGYAVAPTDRLYVQATQSPFFTPDDRNIYGYSLRWNGEHSFYKSIWSANLFEYTRGHYISYLSLGNRFEFGKWAIEADVMNRASSGQAYLFKDCSVIGDVAFAPASRWRIHVKMTYDVNHSGTDADSMVLDGTQLTMAGGGVEFFPLVKDKTDLRLHATAYYSWGKNTNEADVMQKNTLLANIGLTWNMNFLNVKRK